MKSIIEILITLLLGFVYAYFRYVFFKGVEHEFLWPYIFNKAVSLSIMILWSLQTLRFLKIDPFYFKGMIIIHILISLWLLSPEYYPSFYSADSILKIKALSIIGFGIIGSLVAFGFRYSFLSNYSTQFKASVFGSVILLHNSVMGFERWLMPEQWPRMMPPITLISSLFVLVGLVYLWKKN